MGLPPTLASVDLANQTVSWCISCERVAGLIITLPLEDLGPKTADETLETFLVCWDCLPTSITWGA